jgi:hypothetical protein
VKRKGEIIRKEQTLIEPMDDEIPISEASDLVARYKLFYLTSGDTNGGTDFKAVMESAYEENREASKVKLSRSTNDDKNKPPPPSSGNDRKKKQEKQEKTKDGKRKMAASPSSPKSKPVAKGRLRYHSTKEIAANDKGYSTDDAKTDDPEITNRASAPVATTTRDKFDSSSNVDSHHQGKHEMTPSRKNNKKRNHDTSYSPMSFKNTFHVQPSSELAMILHSVEDLDSSDDDTKRKI